MALAEYRRKRYFSKTPEPVGSKTAAKVRRRGDLKFVIQKHDATRLHYDFRLELDGVLKSWAVPKGPSLDPQDKRLAVEVEDHPLEYAKFEGHIPEGEYGAGEVIVWDRGTWAADGDPREGLRRGKLEFHLDGEKLHGGWRLLRMPPRSSSDKNNWLLMKRRDEEAKEGKEATVTEQRPESVKSGRLLERDSGGRGSGGRGSRRAAILAEHGSAGASPSRMKPARVNRTRSKGKARADLERLGAHQSPLPSQIQPQLATLEAQTPTGDQWVHEIKLDGYRVLCWIEKGKARLITRRQQDWTHRYLPVAEEAAKLPVQTAILDGEVVALLPSGISSFQALQNARREGATAQLAYYAFDLLYLDGYDLRPLPLIERKKQLAELLEHATGTRVRLSEHFEGGGPAFFRQCCRMGLEGVISKRSARPYIERRSADWIKTKCHATEELVIGGFTLSTAVKRGIGALLVGYFDKKELVYSGRVGTGFDTRTLLDLRDRLEKLKRDECPFHEVPARERGKEVRWVRPELVAQIEFTGWTDDAILRHPSFQGLREDKPATAITHPQSLTLPPAERKSGRSRGAKQETRKMPVAAKTRPSVRTRSPRRKKTKTEDNVVSLPSGPLRLTSPDRVLYPDVGLTKLGLATYYAQVAQVMLPHVVERPLSLFRCPEGRERGCFFQKHAAPHVPAALERVKIQEEDKVGEYLVVVNVDSLLSLVQMNVLEIHLWGSRRDRLDQPDRIVMDLDPGEGVVWSRVAQGAHDLRKLLDGYGLASFLKTTGGKGLHIVVPLAPRRDDWPAVKQFCRHIADELSSKSPTQYTANMSKAARKGKIFVDYLRNDRGSTAVAPYSTRARPGAPVSLPIAWEELSATLKSDQFHVGNVPKRLAALRSDPWEEIGALKQAIPKKY